MSLSKDLQDISKDLRVLYVDDDDSAREEIKNILKLFFHSVDTASNGRDGLECYSSNEYDIVITDLTMPIMDGVTMIKEIYAQKKDQHIIISTAHNNSKNLMESINLQVDGFLIKPIDDKKLLNLLYKVSNEINNRNYKLSGNMKIPENSFDSLKNMLEKPGSGVMVLAVVDMLDSLEEMFGWRQSQQILSKAYYHIKEVKIQKSHVFNLRRNEFAIYIPDDDIVTLHSELDEFYSRVHEVKIIEDSGISFNISLSLGVYDGNNIHLLTNINTIINKIKSDSSYSYFKVYNGLIEDTENHENILRKITDSVNKSGVVTYFQPVIDNTNGKIDGYEALARLYIDLEYMPASVFIKAANSAGILKDITKNVITSAFKELSSSSCMLYINIGEDWHADFDKYILAECERYSFKYERIVFDIRSQSALKCNSEQVKWLLKMKNMGFKIAIEDFQNRVVNIQTLALLKPEYIKILFNDNIDEKSIHLILGFVNSIGSKTIAIGIENEAMYHKAVELKFDYFMGYYLGIPKALAEADKTFT